jgi:hypothetical protein
MEDSEVIHRREDGAYTAVTLVGLTETAIDDVVTLARSWLNPPPLTLEGPGDASLGYDRGERAYVLARGAGPSQPLEMGLAASPGSPLVNPSFLVRGWGGPGVRLEIDGQEVPPGGRFRAGRRQTLDRTDLVVWVEGTWVSPVQIHLVPVAND